MPAQGWSMRADCSGIGAGPMITVICARGLRGGGLGIRREGASALMSVRRLSSVVVGFSLALVSLPGPTVLATPTPCGTNGAYSVVAGIYSCLYTTQGHDTFTVPPSITAVTFWAIGGKGGDGFHLGNFSGVGGKGV